MQISLLLSKALYKLTKQMNSLCRRSPGINPNWFSDIVTFCLNLFSITLSQSFIVLQSYSHIKLKIVHCYNCFSKSWSNYGLSLPQIVPPMLLTDTIKILCYAGRFPLPKIGMSVLDSLSDTTPILVQTLPLYH